MNPNELIHVKNMIRVTQSQIFGPHFSSAGIIREWGCPRGIKVKVMDYGILVRVFKH